MASSRPAREGRKPGVGGLHLARQPSETSGARFADALQLGTHLPTAHRRKADGYAFFRHRNLVEGSAALGGEGFIQAAHHRRLDARQELGHGEGRDAQRVAQRERRAHVPADHRAGEDAQLAAEALCKIPDLRALKGQWPVQPCRAVGARPRARRAVAFAPAVGPFGEGDEAFFSCSSSRPFAT